MALPVIFIARGAAALYRSPFVTSRIRLLAGGVVGLATIFALEGPDGEVASEVRNQRGDSDSIPASATTFLEGLLAQFAQSLTDPARSAPYVSLLIHYIMRRGWEAIAADSSAVGDGESKRASEIAAFFNIEDDATGESDAVQYIEDQMEASYGFFDSAMDVPLLQGHNMWSKLLNGIVAAAQLTRDKNLQGAEKASTPTNPTLN